MSRTVDGRFTLGPAIGAGAASEVYRARDEQTGEEVALKLATATWPQAEVALRFEREAAALSLLASPHVVHLVAAGSDEDGTPYLAMELLDGRDLQEEVRQEGGLVPLEVLGWFAQAAAAVDLAHGLGIVHRDLKPGNLFLQTRAGTRTLKVLDFGLVKDTSGDLWASGDAFVGTPLYMAPEQVRGHATRVGPSTDVWALGMVAVTLLTGETYWRGPTVGETIADIDGSPLYPPSTRWPFLPPAFDQWFARSCHRVTDKRFRSAAAQAAGLAVALRGMVVREAPASRRQAMGVVSTMLGQRTSDLTALDSELATPQAARGYLVGRQVELRELEGKLGAPGAIVSVTGPGGCGKTRLALAAANSAVEKMDGGVWIVRLGGARELAAAIATAMGLSPDAAQGDLERVAAALADRKALLVIDGFEQASDAAPTLLALRALAPQASWLVTSRLPLGVAGEIRIALEPLERPPPSPRISVNEASSYAAIQLFLVRAREGAPDFALTESNVEAVATICRLVDGLPLAIELAAARVKDHSVAEVAAGLAGSADLVAGPLGWSIGLLGEREQRLLSRLALLPAGATFEGATEICRGVVTPEEVAAALGLLVDGSLLSWTSDQPPRLSMLATVRDFCRARGEDADAWPAVLAQLERIVARAGEGASGDMQDRWASQLDAEWGNLRAALARTETEDPAAMLRLAGGLAWFWSLRGHYREGLGWLERALAGAPSAPGPDRARALHGAGELAFLMCQYAEAEAWLLQATALGEARGVAGAEQRLGSIARERGDYATARERHERSLAAWRAIGDRREAARAESYLVFLDWLSGSGSADASARAAATGEVFAELGDIEGQVWSRLHQGAIAAYAGDPAGARLHLRQAFADAVAARYQEGIAWSLNLLGIVSIAAREWVQARAQLRASLKVHRRLGDRWRCASVLEALAAVSVDTGDVVRGGELLAAAAALRELIGTPVPACERPRVDETAAKATPAPPRSLDAAVILADEE